MTFSVHPEERGWGSNAPDLVPPVQHQWSLCAGHWFSHRAIWKTCSWTRFHPTSSWAFQQHTTGKETLLLRYSLCFTAWGRCWFSIRHQNVTCGVLRPVSHTVQSSLLLELWLAEKSRSEPTASVQQLLFKSCMACLKLNSLCLC